MSWRMYSGKNNDLICRSFGVSYNGFKRTCLGALRGPGNLAWIGESMRSVATCCQGSSHGKPNCGGLAFPGE